MQPQTAHQLAPFFGDDQKIDVSVEEGHAVIKLSTWEEDLGWTCQKTIRLEENLVEDLHRALSAARRRFSSSRSLADQDPAKVIAFPAVS
ncbi:MAG: hypothetical protein DWQ47_16985 [Acidobacteria bacterium]|nr:MAG: hypothetical protein DWQ32_04385 [Acidobacteriota bacterium]REK02261.1 MAG: hypothetical protein DWQ38_07765 [Acidobacteriota bacterium]REK13936.1 MAG: hypothetical protein DWQ43_10075 [Acidobacteriota bacterium]REK41930.1 MAG: hypothetical protein DWQ47_16985 [Acidobacteriota bacterium]